MPADVSREIEHARAIIAREAEALSALGDSLDARFCEAVALIDACAEKGGSVLISGLGKSGLIGAKIASTLSSLGIASHAVHPTEAAHGDLGRFRRDDVCICLSFSGETQEVVNLAAILRQDGVPIIAITRRGGEGPTSLERLARVTLDLPVEREAGEPELLAPTCSTTATLALGDALALCAARRRNFSHADFARRHPGGSLGSLLRPVIDVVRARAGEGLVLVPQDASVAQALRMNGAGRRRSGALLAIDADGRLSGIFTDGDLRRLIGVDPGAIERPLSSVMTGNPRVLRDDAVLRDAVALFREHRQDEIPIVDGAGRPVGLLDVQDLVTLRLVSD